MKDRWTENAGVHDVCILNVYRGSCKTDEQKKDPCVQTGVPTSTKNTYETNYSSN